MTRFINFLHFLTANNIQNNIHRSLSHKEVPTTTTLGKDFSASFTAARFAFLWP